VATYLGGIRPTDVFYTPLPLCHSSATMLGLGPSVTTGTTIVLKKKFSASVFWKDCAHYKATVPKYFRIFCPPDTQIAASAVTYL